MFRLSIIFVFIAVIFLPACAPVSQPSPAPLQETAQVTAVEPAASVTAGLSVELPDAPSPPAEGQGEDTPEPDAASPIETPAWFRVPLTDVRGGQAFTIGELSGKVILLETLAIWCSNCKKQQIEVKALHELLVSQPDWISVGLDIDPNENASDLKEYIESNGFDWTYAVAPAEVSRELANLYGDQFLNPPATPMLLVDRQGRVHLLPFGIKSAAELQNFIQPFLDEGL